MRTLFLTLAMAISSLASTITFEANPSVPNYHSPVIYATEEIEIRSFTFAYTVIGNPVGPTTKDYYFIATPGSRNQLSLIFHTDTFNNPFLIGRSSWSLDWALNGTVYTTTGNSLQIGGSTPMDTPEPPTIALLSAAGVILWRKKGIIA